MNYAANRWKLNQKRYIGATSESIRTAHPNSRDEWAAYYYSNVRRPDQIDQLGKILYDRIKNILPDEKCFHPDYIASITEQDCINYMHYLAIDTPWKGYAREQGRL